MARSKINIEELSHKARNYSISLKGVKVNERDIWFGNGRGHEIEALARKYMTEEEINQQEICVLAVIEKLIEIGEIRYYDVSKLNEDVFEKLIKNDIP